MHNPCRDFQILVMECVDGVTSHERLKAHQDHLDSCPSCRDWMQYLQAEEKAWEHAPLQAPTFNFKPRVVKRPSFRPYLLWASATASVLLLVILVWYQPWRPSLEFDLNDPRVVGLVQDFETISFDEAANFTPSYVRTSSLWWTEEDLKALDASDNENQPKRERKNNNSQSKKEPVLHEGVHVG